ncbi:protein of unknown function [Candidatus Hydrogenisulfobacillus filiaventi]|uniref:Uncharacterized protein n=1 Tax=Candidatus Hydrogenisulfobacillus filiaventi TaxID=2707344 RepID=A0A6F8ZIG5_9FIRM|nr:protein of unknown function [Candidatus Hydrogenisulfobacillus filiaventi]
MEMELWVLIDWSQAPQDAVLGFYASRAAAERALTEVMADYGGGPDDAPTVEGVRLVGVDPTGEYVVRGIAVIDPRRGVLPSLFPD